MHIHGITRKRAFSLCYLRQNHADKVGTEAGALTLGGTDQRLHKSPIMWAENVAGRNKGWYAVDVKAIYLRAGGGLSSAVRENDSITPVEIDASALNAGGIIVDSGTTDTYLKRSAKSPLSLRGRQ